MGHDLARLSSYVRFYQTVVTQMGAACQNIERTHGVVKAALAPFAEPLSPVGVAALDGAMGESRPYREAIAGLWWPVDEKDLSDLNDIYEVVGRFGFQGDDNGNLQRVQWLVAGARNEIVLQRARLSDLRELPSKSKAAAARILAAEQARAGAERSKKLAEFEPLAETVVTRAKQTTGPLRTRRARACAPARETSTRPASSPPTRTSGSRTAATTPSSATAPSIRSEKRT